MHSHLATKNLSDCWNTYLYEICIWKLEHSRIVFEWKHAGSPGVCRFTCCHAGETISLACLLIYKVKCVISLPYERFCQFFNSFHCVVSCVARYFIINVLFESMFNTDTNWWVLEGGNFNFAKKKYDEKSLLSEMSLFDPFKKIQNEIINWFYHIIGYSLISCIFLFSKYFCKEVIKISRKQIK